MKMSFSTLACPDWTVGQIVNIANDCEYQGIEFRFVEGQDALYSLAAFSGSGLQETRRQLSDAGISACCIDTSCRFHFPDKIQRDHWILEGDRMAHLAAELSAPAIRVFGDEIQPGTDRESTRRWIADSIHELASRVSPVGVGVWLETHGDFASAQESNDILDATHENNVGIIWDPANCFIQSGESPQLAAPQVRKRIRHVHIKDLKQDGDVWTPVLTGEGCFPLDDLRSALKSIDFSGFVSFEWEKKWHPEIPPAEIALPHFASWFRQNWNHER